MTTVDFLTSERQAFQSYSDIAKDGDLTYASFRNDDLGSFHFTINKDADGNVEFLLVVDDPDFDTSKIVCLTPDGADTRMPDTRRNK